MLSDGAKTNTQSCSCDACRVSWQTPYDPTEWGRGVAAGSPMSYGIDQGSRDMTTLELLITQLKSLEAAVNKLASRL